MRDGHIHSPYCPHGSNDKFEKYIENAIKIGLEEISFTEHLPMPNIPMDKELLADCALAEDDTIKYIKDVQKLKEVYKNKIKINLGFEVDYIEGYEEDIKNKLNKYGEYIEDSILSVHIVKYNNEYRCIDMLEDFEYLYNKIGSLEGVYDLYYSTIIKSIKSDLGKFKPKRIGHPSLVRKFVKKYPYEYKNIEILKELVEFLKKYNYEVDYNSSGKRKELCGEKYPSGILYELLCNEGIELVNGSDSHDASTVGKF